ncbi:MAG: DEAD/DEAH box helicase [Hyphomicrobiaceae bacterium]
MTTFTDLGLAAPILKALEGEGYSHPTPIQAQAIPVVLAGRDLMGIAQTGTGKTAAFALPILDRLTRQARPAPRGGCRCLVLSPTRELATQIADSFRTYGRHLGISVGVVVGGVSHRPQAEAIRRGLDILVATPGRLIDHVDGRTMTLATTEIFVLDEADQMLDLGFVKPIRRIASGLAQRRQSLFFSATMPREIAELAREFLKNPTSVAVTPQATTVERIDQRVIHVEAKRKRALLAELLTDQGMARTLVFTRTKRGADRVARHLDACGIKAAAIHGNKSQNQREAALDAFRKARVRVLVATDIAARGIDVDGVTHVVNFELPEVPEAYVHRIGRTARAGADGAAISFCDGAERDLLRDIERVTRQRIKAESRVGCERLAVAVEPAPEPCAGERGEVRRGRGGRGSGRPTPRRDGASNRREAGGQPAHESQSRPQRAAGGYRARERVATEAQAGSRPAPPANGRRADRERATAERTREPRQGGPASGGDGRRISDVGFLRRGGPGDAPRRPARQDGARR